MKRVGKVFRWLILGIIAAAIAIPVILGAIKKVVEWNDFVSIVCDSTMGNRNSSRIYFGEKFGIQKGVPELKGYWYLQGNKYIYVSGIISFPGDEYGEFGVSVILVARERVTTTR